MQNRPHPKSSPHSLGPNIQANANAWTATIIITLSLASGLIFLGYFLATLITKPIFTALLLFLFASALFLAGRASVINKPYASQQPQKHVDTLA